MVSSVREPGGAGLSLVDGESPLLYPWMDSITSPPQFKSDCSDVLHTAKPSACRLLETCFGHTWWFHQCISGKGWVISHLSKAHPLSCWFDGGVCRQLSFWLSCLEHFWPSLVVSARVHSSTPYTSRLPGCGKRKLQLFQLVLSIFQFLCKVGKQVCCVSM